MNEIIFNRQCTNKQKYKNSFIYSVDVMNNHFLVACIAMLFPSSKASSKVPCI